MNTTDENLYCRIVAGPRADLNEIHVIPRIQFEYGTKKKERGVRFRRYQFPVRLCFSMSINKV